MNMIWFMVSIVSVVRRFFQLVTAKIGLGPDPGRGWGGSLEGIIGNDRREYISK